MNARKSWSFAGIFVIALIVSMPFYVAEVYATSVSITRNSGSAGIEGYLDGEGDVWTVEAKVYEADAVAAEQMKIRIGSREASFDSCSDSDLGATCEYVSPLPDGLREDAYAFDVVFDYLGQFGVNTSVGDSGSVVADGSAPEITFHGAGIWQDKEGMRLDFDVEDPGLCVGLEKVEVIDVETSSVLWSYNDFEEGDCNFDAVNDAGGFITVKLNGEGRRAFRVVATDRLGHEGSETKSFHTDFVAPVIGEMALGFGEFIGTFEAATDIILNVTEKGEDLFAKAYSDQAALDGDEASCAPLDEEGQWTCTWPNVEVVPADTISVKFEVVDGAGNTAEKTISQSFVVDNSPPAAVYFNTERTYLDVGYISPDAEVENRILLKVDEKGAGISESGIRANLAAIGGGNFDPGICNQTEETFDCLWSVPSVRLSTAAALIGLSYFNDKVGNQGRKPETELIVDQGKPKVERIELYGISEAGQKNYFQSNDILSINLRIAESSGLLILVDTSDLVMDSETKYPENDWTKDLYPSAGWAVFTEEDCELVEGKWECSLEIEGLKSGPDSVMNLKMMVMDTAGNLASWEQADAKGLPLNKKSGAQGKYVLDLLGVEIEEAPDYWEVSYVKPMGGADDFVDMDTTELIPTRMGFRVGLRTGANAKAAKIDLVGCDPAEGFTANSREILFENLVQGATDGPEPQIILEFAPFNSKEFFEGVVDEEKFVEYNCRLNVYSQIGRKAIKNAELQEVTISVPFGFTDLGALDENLAGRIKSAKEGYYDSTKWLDTLSKIFEWLDYIARLVTIITSIIDIYTIIDETEVSTAQPLDKNGLTIGAANLLKGACTTTETGPSVTVSQFVQYIQIPTGILSCTPASEKTYIGDSWYGWWQRTVLNYYNAVTGRGEMGVPAGSLKDNFYISIIGLCVPGVVYNLKQLREIHCRRIVCLQDEVPAGIASVDACDQLYDLLECEFFSGPAARLIPGVGGLTAVGEALKGIISSPLGLINIGEILLCALPCWIPGNGLIASCKAAKVITKLISIVDTIVGAVKNRPDIVGSPYCDMVD